MERRSPIEFDARFRAMLEHSYGPVEMSALKLWRCMAMAHGLLSGALEKRMAQFNLSTSKLRVLLWLKMRADEGTDGGGLLPSELSRFHGVTPNTMSSLLTSMRESGLIEQIDHPKDRRKHIIKITQAGEEKLHEVGPAYKRNVEELFAGLSEEERQILITLLQKVIVSAKSRADCEYPAHSHPHRE
jgi:DNA-binding MarR family transcriptional regulator